MSEERVRANYLPAPHYYALNLACAPLKGAFDMGVYLVGSCLERPNYRDVDVRAIVSTELWTRLFGIRAFAAAAPLWSAMCVGISAHLSQVSGLPIDFQIQEFSAANDKHKGNRSALGVFVGYPGEIASSDEARPNCPECGDDRGHCHCPDRP